MSNKFQMISTLQRILLLVISGTSISFWEVTSSCSSFSSRRLSGDAGCQHYLLTSAGGCMHT